MSQAVNKSLSYSMTSVIPLISSAASEKYFFNNIALSLPNSA